MLTVPFTERFKTLTESQRDVSSAAFLSTAVSSVMLMAPTAYHRIRWWQSNKEHMLRLSNLLAIIGIAFLALAVSPVVFVVTDLLFKGAAAGVATAIVVGALLFFWFAIPLMRRIEDDISGP